MPKRTTLNFSSENAPKGAEGEKLYVYYCKASSCHVLTTDVDLQRAPRRWLPSSAGFCPLYGLRAAVLNIRQCCSPQDVDGQRVYDQKWEAGSHALLPIGMCRSKERPAMHIINPLALTKAT